MIYWNKRGKYQELLNQLYSKLVPDYGKADTEMGEILRAAYKLYLIYYTTGEMVREVMPSVAQDTTLVHAFAFLRQHYDYVDDLVKCDEVQYECLIEQLMDEVIMDAYSNNYNEYCIAGFETACLSPIRFE